MIQDSSVTSTSCQMSPNNKRHRITIIALVVLCILCIVGGSVSCYLLVEKNDEINQLRAELEEREQYIASLSNNSNKPNDAEHPSTDDGAVPSDSESTDGLYWELSKIDMRVPVTQELLDNITLTEVDDGYRLDLNLLVRYREQGCCANGGSTAFGSITKANVSRGFVQDYPVLYSFVNNVVYPKTYIAYNWYGESTMCWDLSEGGQERHDEVEKLVQRLQEPLTQAIEKIEPIK